MTFRTPTIGYMTFRPAARCATDAGGNLRRLIGSAPAGGVSIPIAGRFLRRFRSRFEGRRFREVIPGALPGALSGNIRGLSGRAFERAERKRDVSGWCSADCAPPGGDDRSGMVRLHSISGARGKMPSPRDCHHTTAARTMRSFVVVRGVFKRGLGFWFSIWLSYFWLKAYCLTRSVVAQDRRAFFGGGLHEVLLCLGIPLRISQAESRKSDGEKWSWRDERQLTSHRAGPRRRFIRAGIRLPVLAAACWSSSAHAQIDTVNGYQCNAGAFVLTNNSSLIVDETNPTCQLPVEMAQWFDLSANETFAGQYSTLKCVDFSMWGTNNPNEQLITVRVFQDLTPASSDSGFRSCDGQVAGYDGAKEPGPDLASAFLLGEGETFIPVGVNPPSGPRHDGDFSVEVTGPFLGGILLEPDIAFFITVGHAGEAITQFGGNSDGEVGDSTAGAPGGSTGGPEQTWVRPFNCSTGGACSQTDDWQKSVLYYPDNLDIVMQVHLDLGDTRCHPALCFGCIADFPSATNGRRDLVVNVSDLLILLSLWGSYEGDRREADILPLCTCTPAGDGVVGVNDLLHLLGEWGLCPNLNDSCETALLPGNFTGQVGEGDFFYRISGLLDGPSRPSTNDLNDIRNGPTECGWHDFGPGALPGGFQYGDTFGIDALDPGQGGGDVWFIYTATCSGPVTFSTQTECAGDRIRNTLMEIYPGDVFCNLFNWKELIACDDQSAPGCGDHAQIELDVQPDESYFIRIGGWMGEQGSGILTITPRPEGTPDCNANGNRDAFDICTSISEDIHNNSVPDECDARGDFNGDGFVNVTDLLALFASWGACPICPEDTNLDDAVNVIDLLTLLANWG